MSHFKQVLFTISKKQDIYIDEVLLDDKKKDKKEFSNGRSEYIRKLIDDDMYQKEISNIKNVKFTPIKTNEENGKPLSWEPDEIKSKG